MKWQNLTARDLMRTELVTVSVNTPLAEVEQLLVDHRISGVPVTDAAGHLVGVLSIRDIVEFRSDGDDLRTQSRIDAAATLAEEGDAGAYVTLEETDATAADVMTAEVYSVGVNAKLPAIAREMVERGIHRVLVRDGRHYVGLISTFDVLAEIARD